MGKLVYLFEGKEGLETAGESWSLRFIFLRGYAVTVQSAALWEKVDTYI